MNIIYQKLKLYGHLKALIETPKKALLSLILLWLSSTNVSAILYSEKTLEKEISEAELIIKGTLVDKYSKKENLVRHIRDLDKKIVSTIPRSIFTTFTFKVDEVIKGKYLSNSIQIKMLGGCDNQNNCVGWNFNYQYKENEKALLFIRKNIDNGSYQTTEGSNTAFKLDTNEDVTRKSEKHKSNIEMDNLGNLIMRKKTNLSDIKEILMRLKSEG